GSGSEGTRERSPASGLRFARQPRLRQSYPLTRAVGGVHGRLLDDIDPLLDTLLGLASERGLEVDLHVDESGDPAATALAHVAAAVLRNRFRGRVVCGHCCSLAVQPEEQIRRTLDLCAEAGIAIVTLPTVNLYLQDRSDGRT